MNSSRVVCLLPVRNGGPVLEAWLDDADRFADAVVALDDGSTDETASILRSHPIVSRVLTNERREGYLGWHDGRNRNRLLTAAAELGPSWIFSLDADERMDDEDAVALRRFVATEALQSCAYGFPLYRMVGDDVYDPAHQWVFRLFWHVEGQRFPNRRLDFTPIPTSIPPERRIGTTIRIKHYGETDEAGRRRRIEKYREADPEGVFREYYEHLPPLSTGPFRHWQSRSPTTPLLDAAPRAATPDADADAGRPSVVCLLPARDCAALLPGWFESVARFADAVVALDDGSVDETGSVLRAHPLVSRVISNPVRDGFAHWDDGANRNRLLEAAAELCPEWIISIDADERMPLEDGVALRRFLRDEAQPGIGYGFRSYRMIGDEDHYDRADYDAYRLFAFEPGQVFPADRLHAPPIPTSIPREQWRLTTMRMKHLVALTEAHRQARWEKYQQADPRRVWEPDYGYTVEAAGAVRPWPVRQPDQPFLFTWSEEEAAAAALDLAGPALTLVAVSGTGDECRVVERLRELIAGRTDVEGVVVTRDAYAAEVHRDAVEGVTVVASDPAHSLADLHNTGLGHARGDYVTFTGSGELVSASDVALILDAHDQGHALVGLPVSVPTASAVAAADAALTYGASDGEGFALVDYRSFAREALLTIGGFDAELGRGFESLAARVLIGSGWPGTTIETGDRIINGHNGSSVAGLLRSQYRYGRAMSRNAAPDRHVPAVGLAALGSAVAHVGAARERRRRATRRGGDTAD